MAQLTTVDGYQFNFDPGTVSAVTNHDLTTGEAVTCIYGLAKGFLRIRETVDGFLARVGIGQNFATLTLPSDLPIWVSGKMVGTIRQPLPGEFVDGVQTVVGAGSFVFGVKNNLDDARALLDAHGGKL